MEGENPMYNWLNPKLENIVNKLHYAKTLNSVFLSFNFIICKT